MDRWRSQVHWHCRYNPWMQGRFLLDKSQQVRFPQYRWSEWWKRTWVCSLLHQWKYCDWRKLCQNLFLWWWCHFQLWLKCIKIFHSIPHNVNKSTIIWKWSKINTVISTLQLIQKWSALGLTYLLLGSQRSRSWWLPCSTGRYSPHYI